MQAAVEQEPTLAGVRLPEPVSHFRVPVVLIEHGLPSQGRVHVSHLVVINPNGRQDVAWIDPDTWVPAGHWREHTLQSVVIDRDHVEQGGRDSSKVLGILALPAQIRERLAACHADPAWGIGGSGYFRQGLGAALQSSVDAYTRSLLYGSAFDAKGVAQIEPGLVVASKNPQTRKRVGLHIDSWDQLSIGHRKAARMRISWNVGRQPRYLLLAALCADDVAAFLRFFGRSEASLPRDAKAFIFNQGRGGRRVPVFRICLQPGEAYMVSTDFWAHDATTQPMTETDLRLPYLGHFKVPAGCTAWAL